MPRGGTIQFDRTEALEAAMSLFWEKGYEATGLAELLERMGIGRQSLYNTFGDKRSLFVLALSHYYQTRITGLQQLIESNSSPLEGVRAVLRMYESHNTSGNGLGCLVVNSAAESGSFDAEIKTILRDKIKQVEAIFKNALAKAKKDSELRADTDTRALARALVSTAFGTTLMGRVGVSKAMVADVIRMNQKMLDAYAMGR